MEKNQIDNKNENMINLGEIDVNTSKALYENMDQKEKDKYDLLIDMLPVYQDRIKRDKETYTEEFLKVLKKFEEQFNIFLFDPSRKIKGFKELLMFFAHLSSLFKEQTAFIPKGLCKIISENYLTIPHEIRLTIVDCLSIMCKANILSPLEVIPLFFNLMRCQDKILRKRLTDYIVSSLTKINEKHKNININKNIQNFCEKLLEDPNKKLARKTLNIIINLYQKRIWNDSRTINILANIAVNAKDIKISSAACKFFLSEYNDGNNYVYNKSYTIFDQKFNTTESPDVFFVYEPFITSLGSDYASYAFNDYIIVDSDPYTSVNDPSKIYLVKPNKTWAQVKDVERGIDTTTDKTEEQEIINDLKNNNTNYNYYLTKLYTDYEEEDDEGTISTSSSSYSPVNIDLSYIEPNDGSKPLQIISNISTTKDDAGVYSVINKPLYGKKQFSFDVATSYSDFPGLKDGILDAGESLKGYPELIEYNASNKVPSLSAPTNDNRKSGRLYSITVTFHNTQRPTEANVYTYFTGAKGAD